MKPVIHVSASLQPQTPATLTLWHFTLPTTHMSTDSPTNSRWIIKLYLVCPRRPLVEQHQNNHVVCRYLDNVFADTLRSSDITGRAIAIQATSSTTLLTHIKCSITGTPGSIESCIQISRAMLRLQAQLSATVLAKVKSTSNQTSDTLHAGTPDMSLEMNTAATQIHTREHLPDIKFSTTEKIKIKLTDTNDTCSTKSHDKKSNHNCE